jgi:hypothetical protein
MEIAKLHKLSDLVLTGTDISGDQVTTFAEALNSNKNHRRVQLKLTMNVPSREHVAALLDTGLVSQIDGNGVTFLPMDAPAVQN